MALPHTYRACVLDKPQDNWQLRDVPMRHPKKGEILIKIKCCGFCLTDTDTQAGSLGSRVRWPIVPGHEFIGEVVEVGQGVTKWTVGDVVGGSWHGGHDGTCRQCNQGFFQGCENQIVNGVHRDGGFAEYCNLRSEAATRIPKDVDPVQAASFLCAGVSVFNSMRHQRVMPGETVVVQGIGGLGHLAIQFARKMGYRVIAVSTSDSKRDLAMELGAHHFINSTEKDVTEEILKLGGAKLVLLTAPVPSLMSQYVNCLTWQGKVLIVVANGDITISLNHLVLASCSITGWHAGHAQDCEDAINFARLHDIRCMVETFPLEKIHEAAEHLTSSKARFRVVLTI
ncbi:hypothetical protein HIM_01145 [Hirsutella minnesotensis 3608]|nr:hypothetical protein HIM_01145 [Hirsutella minnesotensis 3608]